MTKSTELKEKIENQISEINNLYKKIDEEVTNSFISKHKKLEKEETGFASGSLYAFFSAADDRSRLSGQTVSAGGAGTEQTFLGGQFLEAGD